jgi:hypothetical protein
VLIGVSLFLIPSALPRRGHLSMCPATDCRNVLSNHVQLASTDQRPCQRLDAFTAAHLFHPPQYDSLTRLSLLVSSGPRYSASHVLRSTSFPYMSRIFFHPHSPRPPRPPVPSFPVPPFPIPHSLCTLHDLPTPRLQSRPSAAAQSLPRQSVPPRSQESYLKSALAAPGAPGAAPDGGIPQGLVPVEPWADGLDEVDARELAMGRFRARQELLGEVFGPEGISECRVDWDGYRDFWGWTTM